MGRERYPSIEELSKLENMLLGRKESRLLLTLVEYPEITMYRAAKLLAEGGVSIDYHYPTADQQVAIWKVLSSTSGIVLHEGVIREWVKKHPHTSGRDVKNLLKLARVISTSRKAPIDLDMLEFALQFKPTVVKEEK